MDAVGVKVSDDSRFGSDAGSTALSPRWVRRHSVSTSGTAVNRGSHAPDGRSRRHGAVHVLYQVVFFYRRDLRHLQRDVESRCFDVEALHVADQLFDALVGIAEALDAMADAGNAGAADPVDRVSSRPDFAVLGYPVISMTEAWTHQGSKTALLGENADAALAARLSGERAVTKDTPPTFMFHTNADTAVLPENSVYYYLALRKAGIPAEMHIFENGPHGVGLANDDPALSEWSKLLANWLRRRGVVK